MFSMQDYYNEVFSEDLATATYFYFCRKYRLDRALNKPSKNYSYSLDIIHLRSKCGFKNYLNDNDKLSMDLNEKKMKVDYWIKEHKAYLTSFSKYGFGTLFITRVIYNRLCHNPEISALNEFVV